MTRKSIRLSRVETSMNTSEVIQVEVKRQNGDLMTYEGIYVPPLTNAWTKRDHEIMLKETMNEMEKIVSRDKNVLMVGDFNCKEINWEERTCRGGENSWNNILLSWAVENLLTQWIDCETRFRGSDNPSRLDLVFTSDPECIETVSYECPLGKSDHVLIEISLSGKRVELQENYKLERYRYN